MATVSQPTLNPTNKLTAAIVASALVELAHTAVDNLAPSWSNPALWTAMTPLVIGIVGYYVKDAPNLSVTVEGQGRD